MPIFSTTLSESGPFTIPDNATLTRTMSFGTTSWARITRISVGLGSLMHTFADDLDFLILGPDGRNLAFWSDAGGSSSINGSYTIADTGAAALSDSGANAPGTYRPTDYATGGGGGGNQQQLERRGEHPDQSSRTHGVGQFRVGFRRHVGHQHDVDPQGQG